jgi:hypothetical protein
VKARNVVERPSRCDVIIKIISAGRANLPRSDGGDGCRKSLSKRRQSH